MATRREFLKLFAWAGIGLTLPARLGLQTASAAVAGAPALAIPGGTLDPNTIAKYVQPLVIPPVMRPHGRGGQNGNGVTQYRIGVRQFQQQILPPGLPQTTVWGYGDANDPMNGAKANASFNYPAFTVEARINERVRVRWANELVKNDGDYLPHLLPVDPTLHWANPPGPPDGHAHFPVTPGPYTGPVPLVTHVHGAHVPDNSDGYPEAWYLPKAKNIPTGYFTRGTHFASVIPAPEGEAVFEYPNDQRATTLWYHDHALGITRLNVYAGLAGFWLLRDEVEDSLNLPGPAPRLGDPPGTKYYEVPVAIQDRSFNNDGSFFYPDSREFFDGYDGPFVPETHVSPIWNPEFFGNTMVVNGKAWPVLEVEPRRYRFRLLNGCNSRFLILQLSNGAPFHVIGTEGGLLPNTPLTVSQLLVAPAERFDVIVDFTGLAAGTDVVLQNLGPDEPFKGFNGDGSLADGAGGALDPADPTTTGQVMQFKVVPLTGADNSTSVESLELPPIAALGNAVTTRQLTIHEHIHEEADIPQAALLGTHTAGALTWMDPITENPGVGDTEVWELINLTEDAHPIHLHLVMFQVLSRQQFDAEEYEQGESLELLGDPRPPEATEAGWKDTVIAYPGEVTRIIARFDLAGLYVWHCHILEHEDNEMMRPYRVG